MKSKVPSNIKQGDLIAIFWFDFWRQPKLFFSLFERAKGDYIFVFLRGKIITFHKSRISQIVSQEMFPLLGGTHNLGFPEDNKYDKLTYLN